MRRALALLALVALFGCRAEEPPAPPPEGPVTWDVSAAVDKSEVQVGEPLVLTLTVRHPPSGDFAAPPESALEPFTVLEQSEDEPSDVETRVVYRLAAYRLPEDLEIPALELRVRNEAGELSSLSTEPIPVRVVSSLTPDVTEIHDIKEPVPLVVPRDWTLLGWALLALVAALAAYLIYRRLRRAREEPAAAPAPPLPAPDVEALEALRKLRERPLSEPQEVTVFHAELAEVVKRYAGRRFDVPFLERTTAEILSDLRSTPLTGSARSELRSVLDACDLVKFARLVPAEDEARRALDAAERLVLATRPAPAAPAESLEATA